MPGLSKLFAILIVTGLALINFGCQEKKSKTASNSDNSGNVNQESNPPASTKPELRKPKHEIVELSDPKCDIKQVMFAGKMVPKLYWSVKYKFVHETVKKQSNNWYHCNLIFVGTGKTDHNNNYQGNTIADSGELKGEQYMHTVGKASDLYFEFMQSGSKTGTRTLIANVIECPINWPAE